MPLTERASAQGIMWTASRLGGALIPFFLAWLLLACGSWRIPFEILAGLGLVWSVAFWRWFRNRPEEVPQVNAGELALIRSGQAAVNADPSAIPWRRMLGSPSVWCLCLMYGCCGPAGNFMFTMLALYLRDHRHLPAETTAWLLSLPLTVGFVACTLGGLTSDWLVRRVGRAWGRRLNGVGGLALAGFSFAAIALVQDVWLLGLLLCATQFGNDFCMGPAWAACADIGERYAGTLSGTMNMTSNITGAAGAALAGYFFAEGQAQLVFVIYGSIYVIGALCWLGIDVTKPLGPRDADALQPEL